MHLCYNAELASKEATCSTRVHWPFHGMLTRTLNPQIERRQNRLLSV